MTEKKKDIKVLVMDVDGTLTDGKINMSESGELYKSFHVKDGYGIAHVLKEKGIIPVVITGRTSGILSRRCGELGIKNIYQNVENKIEVLKKIMSDMNLSKENIAYIGDDLNDLECMRESEVVGCPADAVPGIKSIADFISGKNGGDGAVREFIDWI